MLYRSGFYKGSCKLDWKANVKLFAVVLFLLLYSCKETNKEIDEKPECPYNEDWVSAETYEDPVWHPSGAFIGFNYSPLDSITFPFAEPCTIGIQHFGDSSGFWLVNPDGSNKRRIYKKLDTPAWSHDGQWMAFGKNAQIYKMRFTGSGFDTTTITQLTFTGRNFFPAWSPDGNEIYYDSNVDSPNGMYFIWKMSSDGSNKRRIVYEPTTGEIRMPSVSPDGTKIVHHRYVSATFPEVFIMDTSGHNEDRLTFDLIDARYPKFSQNGSKVYYEGNDIWVVDVTTKNIQNLTSTTQIIGQFSINPGGTELVYVRHDYQEWSCENGVLWILDLTTGAKKQLTYNCEKSTNQKPRSEFKNGVFYISKKLFYPKDLVIIFPGELRGLCG